MAPARYPQLRQALLRQHGLVTRSQLHGMGVPLGTIDHWLRSGQFELVHQGVYRSFGAGRDHRQSLLAAVLALGRTGAASHRGACPFWHVETPGIWGVSETPPVEVTVPGSSRLRLDGAIVHRSTDLLPEHVTIVDGVPVTNPLRLLVDLGAVVPDFVVSRVLDQLLIQKLVTTGGVVRMHTSLARRGRRGCGVLRRVLRDRGLGLDSPESTLESAFADLCVDHGLPLPTYQCPLAVAGRHFRVDFAYEDLKIAIEVDGWQFHGTHEAFQADRTRSNELLAAGWIVLRFTWHDVIHRPEYVARIVRDARRRALR